MSRRDPEAERLVEAFLARIEGMGLSQNEVGDSIEGVTQTDVWRWTSGRYERLSAKKARALRRFLGEDAAPVVTPSSSRATVTLDTLSRAGEIRRFDGHLGIGSRVAIVLKTAEVDDWNRGELLEALERIQSWADEAEVELSRLHRELRRRERSDDPGGDP